MATEKVFADFNRARTGVFKLRGHAAVKRRRRNKNFKHRTNVIRRKGSVYERRRAVIERSGNVKRRIVGHARHGKDIAARRVHNNYGACAEVGRRLFGDFLKGAVYGQNHARFYIGCTRNGRLNPRKRPPRCVDSVGYGYRFFGGKQVVIGKLNARNAVAR